MQNNVTTVTAGSSYFQWHHLLCRGQQDHGHAGWEPGGYNNAATTKICFAPVGQFPGVHILSDCVLFYICILAPWIVHFIYVGSSKQQIFAWKWVKIYSYPVHVQVYCSVMGWMDFRACGSSTFQYVLASMNPKFLLSSGSMSEDSLNRVAGWCCPSSD